MALGWQVTAVGGPMDERCRRCGEARAFRGAGDRVEADTAVLAVCASCWAVHALVGQAGTVGAWVLIPEAHLPPILREGLAVLVAHVDALHRDGLAVRPSEGAPDA